MTKPTEVHMRTDHDASAMCAGRDIRNTHIHIHQTVIDRDGGWCLMHLAGALRALSDLCASEVTEGEDEQLNLLKRGEISSLFAVLGDYADAARKAMPEETRQ